MPTPPRDYTIDHAPPMPDGVQPDLASAPAVAIAEGEAWRDSVQRTDEIELLISAAVFFGLLQVPNWLIATWEVWSASQSSDTFKVGYALMQIGYGVVFVLLVAFFFHLTLRALWIGFIGLRSVFPQGIDWRRLERAAPITTAYQRARTPSIEAAIVSVDRIASTVFAAASIVIIMTLFAVVFVVLGIVLKLLHLGWLTWTILVALTVPVLLQLVLDYGLAARSPGWAAKPWLRRTVTAIATAFSPMMPRGLLLTPMLTLQSRASQLWFTLGLIVAMVIVLMAFPMHLRGRDSLDGSAVYARVDDAIARHGITEPAATAELQTSSLPRLDSVQVAGPFVELFVPILPARDDATLRARCRSYRGELPDKGMDAATSRALRDCIAALWLVKLDGIALESADFDLARKGPQRGLLAMLPTSGLAPGRHQVVATRLPIRVAGEKFVEPPTPRSLLFWVAR